MVKATRKDCYFNRYGCGLYRNTAQLSESHICFCDKAKFFVRASMDTSTDIYGLTMDTHEFCGDIHARGIFEPGIHP